MTKNQRILIREAHPKDDSIIARHFYQLWRDNQIPAEEIHADWQTIVLEFIHQARQNHNYQAFIAEDEHQLVASVSCQLFAGLYPLVLTENYRKYGYIWGVYVEPNYRRQGIATQLTQSAIAYLKSLGCTHAILHASPAGQPVYSSLGFSASNEMRLDL